jgi:hypothetical protein
VVYRAAEGQSMNMRRRNLVAVRWRAATLCTLALTFGCHAAVKPVPPESPSAGRMEELWREPPPDRDLYGGIGGMAQGPTPGDRYRVVALKTAGFSQGYTVTDSHDRKWSVKFPPEAQPEVTASRLFWGLGYHQVPVYLLPKWNGEKTLEPNPQRPARFRAKDIVVDGAQLKEGEAWSYYQNPFVGSRELAGMIVLHVMLGNSDLKDQQNVMYLLDRPIDGSEVWYVARDLGHSFGRSGLSNAKRNDIEAFEKSKFITGVENGVVKFDFHGRHGALVDRITPADVRWICSRLNALSDRQWRDAFRAGAYDSALAARFISRMKQKIAEGLSLPN